MSKCTIWDSYNRKFVALDPDKLPPGWIDLKKTPIDDVVLAKINNHAMTKRDRVEVRRTEHSGLGLFATEELEKGSLVASYGGVVCKSRTIEGDYVIYNPETKTSVDTERFFQIGYNGRFINEPPYAFKEWENVKVQWHGNNATFVTQRIIQKGEEILLHYGPQYTRQTYGWEGILKDGSFDRISTMRDYFRSRLQPATTQYERNKIQKVLDQATAALEQPKCHFCSYFIGKRAGATATGDFCSSECAATFAWLFGG